MVDRKSVAKFGMENMNFFRQTTGFQEQGKWEVRKQTIIIFIYIFNQ